MTRCDTDGGSDGNTRAVQRGVGRLEHVLPSNAGDRGTDRIVCLRVASLGVNITALRIWIMNYF